MTSLDWLISEAIQQLGPDADPGSWKARYGSVAQLQMKLCLTMPGCGLRVLTLELKRYRGAYFRGYG